jgi:hypothetical protein
MGQNLESNKPMLRGLVDAAETRIAARTGVKRPVARAALAREWRVPFWTLTNFRRGRLKDLRSGVREHIRAGVIRGIETEIQRLQHDLLVARQSGAALPEAQILQASVALEQARAFLKG